MKYLHKFNTATEFSEAYSSNYLEPGTSLTVENGDVNYNKFNANGHEYIDLGLPSGTLGATMNIGANSTSDPGGYYAGGETSTKEEYSGNTYKFGTADNLTKYNDDDDKHILDLEDDVVNITMGGDGHIPTTAQGGELFDYTDHEHIYNPIDGYKFMSRTDPEKGIFLPSGYPFENTAHLRYSDLYYGSNSDRDTNSAGGDVASHTYYDGDAGLSVFKYTEYKCYGLLVRGVLNPKPKNYLETLGQQLSINGGNPVPDGVIVFDDGVYWGDLPSVNLPNSIEDYLTNSSKTHAGTVEKTNMQGVHYLKASEFTKDIIKPGVRQICFMGKITDPQQYVTGGHYSDYLAYYTDIGRHSKNGDYGVNGTYGCNTLCILKDGDDYYRFFTYTSD